MKVVILSGKQGSGKTTIQRAIVERYLRANQKAVVVNFADIIYEMHDEVLKILDRYWPKRGLVKDGPLLQLLGTEWGRKTIDPDVWVKCLKERVKTFHGADLVVVGDCRFENEFLAFPEALRVRLKAREDVRKKRCSMWRENTTHPSEVGLDELALANKFDLSLDTEQNDVGFCVMKIMQTLEEGTWAKDRL